MLVLGIETSCDETSAAVVEDGRAVRSCVIASSKHDFSGLGGVIPEQAARRQVESIVPVIDKALSDARVTMQDIGLIAVTCGPGLLGSLLVGTTTARAMASIAKVPIIGVHHTLGHLSSTWLKDAIDQESDSSLPSFPVLTLSVSGGHSDLYLRTAHTEQELIGTTRDDAAGEAFDKGAVLLGLGYPGGPALSALAQSGDAHAYPFPLPLSSEETLDFSFSGLKTALKYLLRDLGLEGKSPQEIPARVRSSIAASYEYAICRHLTQKLDAAIRRFPSVREIHIVGGVAANRCLREMAADLSKKTKTAVRFPASIRYCTDNGAMIASAGYFATREKPELINHPFLTRATTELNESLSTTVSRAPAGSRRG